MRLLKLSVSLLLLVLGLEVALSARILSQGGSTEPQRNNELDSQPVPAPFTPKIGVYLKNYAGRVESVIGESSESSGDPLIVTLPVLKVEDHIWEGKSLTLECWGNKPSIWEYRGHGVPSVRVTTERKAPDFWAPGGYSFGSIVTFSSTRYGQTGEYTCRPVGDEGSGGQSEGQGSSPVFLFVPGKRLFVLNKEEETDNVTVVSAKESSSWVGLPCVVTDPGAEVDLFSVQRDGGLKQLKLSSALEYDPTEGFRLKWKGMGAQRGGVLWGDYLCVGKSPRVQEERLLLKLKAPTPINRFALQGSGSGSRVVALNYNPTSRRIECCSERGVAPRMRLSPCVSISDCYLTSGGMSSCSEGGCGSDSFITPLNESCVAYELPEVHEAGVADCGGGGGDGMEAQMQFSYEPNLGFMTEFDAQEVQTRDILDIGRETGGNQGQGQGHEGTYYCRMNSFFFSDGIKWAVEGKGKDKRLQFINDADGRPVLQVDESRVGRVYCFAPVWNSATAWRNVSMSVPG